MFAVALSLAVLVVMVVILLLVEVRQYRTGRRMISRRRFVLRLVTGLLMLVLLAAVFVGLFVLRLTEARANLSLFMGYWSACLIVALALVFVMMADMREVGDRLTERQHEIWRDMARFIADRGRVTDGEEADPGPQGRPQSGPRSDDEE
jgi:hypothetical protein